MPRFETRQTELGSRAQHWSHAPEHKCFFLFQDTKGWSPPLPVCGEEQADQVWWAPVCVGEEGARRGHKAASNLSQRADICLGLSLVWELRARERVAQTGLAPEKSRGTDGTGLRSQGIAPLGEVELVPSAGRGGWQCLSGPDPLPQQLPTLSCWGGLGGVARALVLSGDGGPDAMCPTCQNIMA